jgi:pimeloyl-ACP methyl ester carboxylesterase
MAEGSMVREFDVDLGAGRRLHAYDTGEGAGQTPVVWHHGTPNIGTPPEPLFDLASRLGLRWLSYDRPGYGGSTPVRDRTIGDAADDVAAIADSLGIERFAVIGHSGGSPHALASAARLGDRVLAAVSMSGLAPFGAGGLDWFAGMCASGEGSLRAAAAGRPEKERYEGSDPNGDLEFTPADEAALQGEWSWVLDVVRPALAAGPAALIDDDLAYVAPWGFDPADITVPTLFVHGERDRVVPSSHSRWLAEHVPGAELRLEADDGHVSILTKSPAALVWLRDKIA